MRFIPTIDIYKNKKKTFDIQKYQFFIFFYKFNILKTQQNGSPNLLEQPQIGNHHPVLHPHRYTDWCDKIQLIIHTDMYRPCREKHNFKPEEVKALLELMHNKTTEPLLGLQTKGAQLLY